MLRHWKVKINLDVPDVFQSSAHATGNNWLDLRNMKPGMDTKVEWKFQEGKGTTDRIYFCQSKTFQADL